MQSRRECTLGGNCLRSRSPRTRRAYGPRSDNIETSLNSNSLREGLDKTLAVMRLDLAESLERVLSSTNLIENLFSRVREMARRVKRWQGGEMTLRWTAAGVLPSAA